MKTFILSALLLSTGLASAATGFFGNAYVITDSGSGATYNQIVTGTTPGTGAASGYNLTPDGVNPAFTALGSFAEGSTLTLQGFEYKTFNDNSSNVTHANLYYRIFSGSPTGSFTQVQTSSPILISGNDKTWSVTNGTTNLLSGLTAGSYSMEVYTESYTNGVNTAGNIFGFTSGNNPVATFSIFAVPEPSRALLLMLGLLVPAFRRRR